MIDYSDIFRSQAESLNTAGMEGILRAADVPREVAQNFSVKEIVLNMLSGDAAVNQEKVLDLLKTMFFGEIRGLVSLAAPADLYLYRRRNSQQFRFRVRQRYGVGDVLRHLFFYGGGNLSDGIL